MAISSREKEWRPIPGYEGLYEASNYGEIRSLPRATTKGRILKQYINPKHGYAYVSLSKNNKQKAKRVHIAVVEAFTDYRSNGFNPDAVIDHIDSNKLNNCLWNLEVCTQKENDRRSRENKLQEYKGIECIDLESGKTYKTYSEAGREIFGRTKCGEKIRQVCLGKRSHYRNRHFARLEDYRNGTIPAYSGKNKRKASESLWR